MQIKPAMKNWRHLISSNIYKAGWQNFSIFDFPHKLKENTHTFAKVSDDEQGRYFSVKEQFLHKFIEKYDFFH